MASNLAFLKREPRRGHIRLNVVAVPLDVLLTLAYLSLIVVRAVLFVCSHAVANIILIIVELVGTIRVV